MRLAIVIPTYQRIRKLGRCLDSIGKNTYKDVRVIVYADAYDLETHEYIINRTYSHKRLEVVCLLNEKREYVIGCWNSFAKLHMKNFDAMAWIVDDVELYPNCLEEAVKSMQTNFPDTDGVVGLSQECPGHPEYTYKPYGQCLIGKKFIERYESVNYQVCCPDYTHFYQDEEMHKFATSLGKFKSCETAILKHYHPSFIKEEMDTTHPIVRGEVMKQDTKIYTLRKEQGLCWGKSWNLINK